MPPAYPLLPVRQESRTRPRKTGPFVARGGAFQSDGPAQGDETCRASAWSHARSCSMVLGVNAARTQPAASAARVPFPRRCCRRTASIQPSSHAVNVSASLCFE
jgi:hypothetical protein